MKNYFHLPVPYHKRKTRIALIIRLTCIGFAFIIYLLSILETKNEQDNGLILSTEDFHHHHHRFNKRQLLNINESISSTNVSNQEPLSEQNVPPNTITFLSNTTVRKAKNCTKPAIFEFPADGLTRLQRQHGLVIVHLLIACYCFWLLAIVCDNYFVPLIEMLCLTMNLKEDVVGATFMAAVTSSPALFINCVGTFVTKGDLGVGTIVGSSVFNTLAVPACCGLLARQIIHLDWWPVSRDCLMYAVAVLSLIGVLYDGRVMWFEALALVCAYLFYICAMYCNDMMARRARIVVSMMKRKSKNVRPFREVNEIAPLLTKTGTEQNNYNGTNGKTEGIHLYPVDSLDVIKESNEMDVADSPWRKNDETSYLGFICRWPITLLLWFTIPDCRKYPKLRALTFFMCIVWIGVTSYCVAFLITVIGDTINIPDSVMGLTLLAAGTSVPEAVSSVIVTNQGHGAMGISNSIGSNTFDILLCLGLPWFVKAFFFPQVPGEQWVVINSAGITYSAICLLTTLFGLYISFAVNKFRLDWKIGLTCAMMYIGFIIFASLVELNYFFHVNLPVCDH